MRLLPRRRLKPLAATVMGCDACCRATEQVSPCRRDNIGSVTSWMPRWFEYIGARRNTEAGPHYIGAVAQMLARRPPKGLPLKSGRLRCLLTTTSHLTHASIGRTLQKFAAKTVNPVLSALFRSSSHLEFELIGRGSLAHLGRAFEEYPS